MTVAGSFFSQTRISVDGSTINDRFVGGTTQNFSQESVQEFQISTFDFDLASGTPGAGVINIISRRGENNVHGSGLFYYRDHNIAAYPGLSRRSTKCVAVLCSSPIRFLPGRTDSTRSFVLVRKL